MSDHQFSFRKALSIIDAIEMVQLSELGCHSADLDGKDVTNYLLELIRDYFRDRVLIYDTDDSRKSYEISAAGPQCSVLGPVLRNVMYDGVLRLRLPKGA